MPWNHGRASEAAYIQPSSPQRVLERGQRLVEASEGRSSSSNDREMIGERGGVGRSPSATIPALAGKTRHPNVTALL
jgi:hypothetical protein